ncbi:MAG: OmpA family protein [Ignavibacterium sp.]|nr:OmpA family protein [Ignavibacterium sp.]
MKSVTATSLSLKGSISFGTGSSYLINLFRSRFFVLEIEDVFFRLNSAVMMPDSIEDTSGTEPKENKITGLAVLKTVFIRLQEFPEQKILIAGHADTSGQKSYNLTLSELRAESVLNLLEGNKDRWVQIVKSKNKNEDVQQILTWISGKRMVDCDPDGIDGIIGTKTKTAIENFQIYYNQEFNQSIKEDGIVGTQTWGAFFDIYQDELAKMLDITSNELTQSRSSLKWQFNNKKFVGCGENWPIEESEKNNFRSHRNRRVEILFFDPEEIFNLDCHAGNQCQEDLCPLYPATSTNRDYLPVHVHPRPQSIPTLFTIEQPGASNFVRMHSVYAYLVYFDDETNNIKSISRYSIKDGKLCSMSSGNPMRIDCNREGYFYFSHRSDLLTLNQNTYFKKDKSGLPLLGPFDIPCGSDAKIELNIWEQKDWIIIRGVRIDGERPDEIKMVEWNENYTIGYHATLKSGKPGFVGYGDCREKERQERWKGSTPIDLIHLGNPGNNPMWVGTLSALPVPKVKIIFVHKVNTGGMLNVGSFNEILPAGDNIDIPAHHFYDENLVNQLVELSASNQSTAAIDALPEPPPRCLVQGDMCWQDQGQTNNCGPYSFSTAMNYWFPYTNNPAEKNGNLYAKAGNVDDTINGARTPGDIVNAAQKFNMFGRDNDAEKLNKQRALKVLKLWLKAGIPVLILVKEEYTLSSYHWKTVVGYDGNRFFMNNSGADLEIVVAERTPGVLYERAPVGNDVDSDTAFYNKWKAAGGDIVDAFTSVDECTFIPLYPKDPVFKGTKAR